MGLAISDIPLRTRHLARRGRVLGSVFGQQMIDLMRTLETRPDVGTAWVATTEGSAGVPGRFIQHEFALAGLDTQMVLHDEVIARASTGFADGVPDVAIVRSMPPRAMEGYAELERRGVPLMNSVESTRNVRSKIASANILSDAGISHPATREIATVDDLLAAGDDFGWPMVVKADKGAGGKQVWSVSSPDEAAQLGARLLTPDTPTRYLTQQFVDGKTARDVRAYVIRRPDGEFRLEAAMIRQGAQDDFRANSPRGTIAWRIPHDGSHPELPPASVQTAIDGARAMNLEYAGVDMSIPHRQHAPEGGMIFEVNGGSPGIIELDAPFPRDEHVLPHIAARAAALAQGTAG